MAARDYGQYGGVTSALEQVGERWALLIIRDLLVGPRRYSDLKSGLPRIPTNILSTRLKELQESGIVRRVPLAHGLAYQLTDYGQGLEDIVLALGRWGFQRLGEPREGEIITPDSMTMALRAAFRADAAVGLPATCYETQMGGFTLAATVIGSKLTVARVQEELPSTRLPDLRLSTGHDIHGLISGSITPQFALERGLVTVLHGDPALLTRFVETFRYNAA